MDRRDSDTSLHSHKSGGGSSGIASESRDSASAESYTETTGAFAWKNQWQHIVFFLSYTFSWETFSSYTHGTLQHINYQPTIIHFLIVYAFFIGPTIFLETFIGQYTQKGCIVLGAMLPVAYGLGYCFLLTTLIDVIVNAYYNSVAFYYILLSMVNWPTPAWMLCLPEFLKKYPNCFSLELIRKCVKCGKNSNVKCFQNETNKFSAEIFKNMIVLGAEDDTGDGALGKLNFTQFAHLTICFIVIGLLATRALRDLDGAVRICNVFGFISIILIVFVILLHSKRINGLYAMFEDVIINSYSLIDQTGEIWFLTFMRLVRISKLASGGHILFGTYITSHTNTKKRAFAITLAEILVLMIIGTLTFTVKNFLACKVNVPMKDFTKYSNHDLTFVIYPTALGILPASPLWSTVFFIVLYTMTLLSVSIQIIIIEESLSNEIQGESYYIYIRLAIIIVAFIGAATLATPRGYYLSEKIMTYRSFILLINLFLFYLVIFTYGVQRISDDIHFLLRRPTSLFFRVFAVITPIICLVTFYRFYHFIQISVHHEILIVLICLYVAPLAIGLIYKIITAVKAKNLTELLMPSEDWGPSDLETRTMRRLYTPRFEVRFRRRFDRCRHRCLLHSPVLLKTLEKELAQLSNVLLEIEDNEEEREAKQSVIVALKRHRDIMSNFIAETSLHKNYHD